MGINYKILQDDSEIECTKVFLESYNNNHGSNYKNPSKNQVQNEVDVICYDAICDKYIIIQVKKADPIIVGDLGRSRKIDLAIRPLIFRDNNQAVDRILNNISKVEGKYLKQDKDMSDVFLLLDEMMNPPEFVINSIRSRITSSSFKEIWIITRAGCAYLLYD
jgi:hypothetical protein